MVERLTNQSDNIGSSPISPLQSKKAPLPPRICVQCHEIWQPASTERACKRCVSCRSTTQKNIATQCTECKRWVSLRPAAHFEQKGTGNPYLCGKCLQADVKRSYVASGDRIARVAVPCGTIRKAKEGRRCNGYRVVGGCEHYSNCLDVAIKNWWDGWEVIQ